LVMTTVWDRPLITATAVDGLRLALLDDNDRAEDDVPDSRLFLPLGVEIVVKNFSLQFSTLVKKWLVPNPTDQCRKLQGKILYNNLKLQEVGKVSNLEHRLLRDRCHLIVPNVDRLLPWLWWEVDLRL
jgi:hypothetical protein